MASATTDGIWKKGAISFHVWICLPRLYSVLHLHSPYGPYIDTDIYMGVWIRGKLLWLDFCCQVSLLSRSIGDSLVQLLQDLDEASTIDLSIPLQIPQLTSEFKQSSHEVIPLIAIN